MIFLPVRMLTFSAIIRFVDTGSGSGHWLCSVGTISGPRSLVAYCQQMFNAAYCSRKRRPSPRSFNDPQADASHVLSVSPAMSQSRPFATAAYSFHEMRRAESNLLCTESSLRSFLYMAKISFSPLAAANEGSRKKSSSETPHHKGMSLPRTAFSAVWYLCCRSSISFVWLMSICVSIIFTAFLFLFFAIFVQYPYINYLIAFALGRSCLQNEHGRLVLADICRENDLFAPLRNALFPIPDDVSRISGSPLAISSQITNGSCLTIVLHKRLDQHIDQEQLSRPKPAGRTASALPPSNRGHRADRQRDRAQIPEQVGRLLL